MYILCADIITNVHSPFPAVIVLLSTLDLVNKVSLLKVTKTQIAFGGKTDFGVPGALKLYFSCWDSPSDFQCQPPLALTAPASRLWPWWKALPHWKMGFLVILSSCLVAFNSVVPSILASCRGPATKQGQTGTKQPFCNQPLSLTRFL